MSIKLYLKPGPDGTLNLGPEYNDVFDSPIIASCPFEEQQELEAAGGTFEEWLEQGSDETFGAYAAKFKDLVLYNYATDEKIREYLQSQGFTLPLIRFEQRADAAGVPALVNTTPDYVQQVKNLFTLTVLYGERGVPYFQMSRQNPYTRFIVIEDPDGARCAVQLWDWAAEDWAENYLVSVAVTPEELAVFGSANHLMGQFIEKLDKELRKYDSSCYTNPFFQFLGTGEECDLKLGYPARVYQGVIYGLDDLTSGNMA